MNVCRKGLCERVFVLMRRRSKKNTSGKQKKYERKTKKHPTGLFRPIGHFNGADNRI